MIVGVQASGMTSGASSDADGAFALVGDHARPVPILDPARLRELTRLDGRVAAFHIALEWTGIVFAVVLTEAFFSWPAWGLACVWIGARLHALGIMAHDGTHGLLTPHRRLNDLVVELCLAWPVFLSLTSYRRMHRDHHRFLNTERDPDWARNRPDRLAGREGWLDFARVMLGLHGEQRRMIQLVHASAVDAATGSSDGPQTRPMVPRWAIYVLVVGVATATGSLALLAKYWLAPFFSWFLVSMRLKGTAEHFAVENDGPLRATRTLPVGFLARTFIAPKNVHFHLEHHLYPSVPFYRLPQLHTALMENPEHRARAHVTPSYFAYLRECVRFGRTSSSSTAG